MVEKNDLHAFTINEYDKKEDKRDREEFISLTRKAHLKLFSDSLRVKSNDNFAAEIRLPPLPTPPPPPEPEPPPSPTTPPPLLEEFDAQRVGNTLLHPQLEDYDDKED